jgi:hypothetical protein
MANEIITPRWPTGERVTLEITREDSYKIHRGRPWVGTVTDQATGIVYTLRGAVNDPGGIVIVSAWNPAAIAQG